MTDYRSMNRPKGRAQPVEGGPTCTLLAWAQQIVKLRLRTARPVAEIKPLLEWADLAPEHKCPALREVLPDKKGHPPHGS